MSSAAVRGFFATAAMGFALCAAITVHAAPADTTAALEPETSDVVTMEPPKPNWFFVDGGWDMPGTSIFDGDIG